MIRSIRAVRSHYLCVKWSFFALVLATAALHLVQTSIRVNVLDSCFIDRSDAAIDHAAHHAHSAGDVTPTPPDGDAAAAAKPSAAGAAPAGGKAKGKKKHGHTHRVLFGLLTHGQSESAKWFALAVCFVVLCWWPEESFEFYYYQYLADKLNGGLAKHKHNAAATATTTSAASGDTKAAADARAEAIAAAAALDDYPPVWTGVWLSVTYCCLSYLWYLSIYFLCNALKSLLDDHTCHKSHGNSVSGHYLFHIFALSQLYHLHIMQQTVRLTKPLPEAPPRATDADAYRWGTPAWQQRMSGKFQRWVGRYFNTPDTRTQIFTAAYTLLAILSANTLFETYFWGFHSLRQVLYGSALAFLAQWLFLNLLHTFLHGFPTHGHAYHVARYFAVGNNNGAPNPSATAATTDSGATPPSPVAASAGHIGMIFPRPNLAHDLLNAAPSLSSDDNTRPIFPLFLHGASAVLQVVCLTAVALSRDRLVYTDDIVCCAVLWIICAVVYRYRLRTPALMAAKRKQAN